MLKSVWWHVYLLFDSLFTFARLLYFRFFEKDEDTQKKHYYRLARQWAKRRFFSSDATIEVKARPLAAGRSYIVIANHQSSFDIFALMAFLPFEYFFLSKRLYFYFPLIGTAMRMINCVPINRYNKRAAGHSLEKASTELSSRKRSLIIFPEGTRSRNGKLNRFKLGALTVMEQLLKKKAKCEVTLLPIVLLNTRALQAKGSLKIKSAKTRMVFLEPLSPTLAELEGVEAKKRLMEKIKKTFEACYERESASLKNGNLGKN